MKLTYLEAITHVRRLKNFYSIKQIAEYMGIAPSMLRNIIDEREIINGNRKKYIQKMPAHHKEKLVECVELLTKVKQIEPEWNCEGLRG